MVCPGINQIPLTGRNPWTSAMLKKLSFKLLSSKVASVDVTCAEALGISALAVRCESNVQIGKAEALLLAKRRAPQGKMSTLSRRGAPYWERTKFC